MVTTKGNQSTDNQGRLFKLVPLHGTIALFGLPANLSFISIIHPVQNRVSIQNFPGAISEVRRREDQRISGFKQRLERVFEGVN